MKIRCLWAVLPALLLISGLSACGGGSGSSPATDTVSSADRQALADKLAAEAEKVPEPDKSPTEPTTAETGSAGEAPEAAAVDKLLGEWNDVINDGRYVKITKEGDTYKYEDNDGAYSGKMQDGILVIQVSESPDDTARVFIDASTGNLVTDYQGDIYEFSRKLN